MSSESNSSKSKRSLILVAVSCFLLGMGVESIAGSISKLSQPVGLDDVDVRTKYEEVGSPQNNITIHQMEEKEMDPAQYQTNQSSPKDHPTITLTQQYATVDDIIPDKLKSTYASHRLQFNVTTSMLRQSRPVIGNSQRLHAYLKKLQSQQCTTVLFLGGSVTQGHQAGGRQNAYPKFFMEWLNERYPCGTTGRHEAKFTHAPNSQSHFVNWPLVSGIDSFDLVFLEFNVNDNFISRSPHFLEDKSYIGTLKDYKSNWYFEAIVRRLLLLRKPDPVAIVVFNADYVGRTWATFDNWFDPLQARQTLFRSDQGALKQWLSSMYEIPVFSASGWMLPLASKMGMRMQFNKTNPYATSNWHVDACCHPRRNGHLILSMVLMHCMAEEEKSMQSVEATYLDVNGIEHDYSADDNPLLREPIYLSPDEEAMYVRDEANQTIIDFTDPRGEMLWKDVVVANEGWKWYADNRDKDKYGFIADNLAGGEHLALSVTGGKYGLVEISYVMSYKDFGISLAWLDDSHVNEKNKPLCATEFGDSLIAKKVTTIALKTIWDEKASVPTIMMMNSKIPEGEEKILHFCLTPHSDEANKGKENKFKLLGVRVY